MKPLVIDDIPRYTYSDYEQWEGRWELIQGIAYAMSPLPTIEHQDISANIAIELARTLQDCQQCRGMLPVDWKIDEQTVVQPDNLVVCGEVSGKYLAKAPVLIFEILSPSTAYKDRRVKSLLYADEGVKYYVIVEVHLQMAEVYELHDGEYEKLTTTQNETVEFDLGEYNMLFDFGKIWPV